jgi:hypothetical protein
MVRAAAITSVSLAAAVALLSGEQGADAFAVVNPRSCGFAVLKSTTTTTNPQHRNNQVIGSGTTTRRSGAPSSALHLSTKSKTTATSSATEDAVCVSSEGEEAALIGSGFSYVDFAQQNPFLNNLMIATTKTAAADLLAQTVFGGTPLGEVDLQRSLLFCLFGCVYLGGFQYLYQVQIFKKMFDVDRFTQQTLEEKLQDGPGLQALAAQTALDLAVLTAIYLPTFYIFKALVFSGTMDPSVWVSSGFDTFQTNFAKDEVDLIKVWLPADLVCFSVPLYLRLPVRHVVSFVWTAYLSFFRGGH